MLGTACASRTRTRCPARSTIDTRLRATLCPATLIPTIQSAANALCAAPRARRTCPSVLLARSSAWNSVCGLQASRVAGGQLHTVDSSGTQILWRNSSLAADRRQRAAGPGTIDARTTRAASAYTQHPMPRAQVQHSYARTVCYLRHHTATCARLAAGARAHDCACGAHDLSVCMDRSHR